ncbi:uncharacterized protein LOC119555222 isoform X1 [Drosophila subpulchrella]|uniref:uncharacterized protein LOC119555222 isoform X1 n=1 Tax=Drosophila subpulchrella TaxID=1486046 RepID=UPI0018A13B92|nr:uncharacterized protein LOC119555222 isoform X1 [Drosophila subpulchrella]
MLRWPVVCLLLPLLATAKFFDRCELANLLQHRFGLPAAQVATLVCIAQHSSDFNTAAFGGGAGLGGGSHGLFQISDVYWCSPPGQGKGCGLSCSSLRDDDIADDVLCVRKIYAEHQRISGDGFTAWQAYGAYCSHDAASYVAGCGGPGSTALAVAASYQKPQQVQVHSYPVTQYYHQVAQVQPQGKIYSRCELAQELFYQHKLPMPQIPTWVCIAQHESSFNTAAVGRLNADGSADHGLFQISDLFWCTHDQRAGKGCHATCNQFLDTSIADDVQCIRRIHQEHTQISGDGFNAWTVYQRNCLNQHYEQVAACFAKPPTHQHPNAIGGGGGPVKPKELATWVCIAEHESSFKTAAVGRLNADGSADHGLFQISDLYWCTHGDGGGKGCHIDCNRLLDSDITDDVRCVRTIYEEHTRISGDGFTAWTVYNGHCRQKTRADIAGCFEGKDLPGEVAKPPRGNELVKKASPHSKGKIYNRCELAKELYHKHKLPMKEIPTWVCIAQHESSFNTAAVGKLNSDGSEDHGLFQISDIYWCSHDQTSGKACHIECDRLLDSDISDDVQCIRTIHEEHTRLSGDGFNAWTVYNGHCRNQNLAQLSDCFEGNEIAEADKISPYGERPQVKPHQLLLESPQQKKAANQNYVGNPFLQAAKQPTKVKNKITNNISAPKEPQSNKLYASNPFFNNQLQNKPNLASQKPNYERNPFLKAPMLITPTALTLHTSGEVKPHVSLSYAQNPFLSLLGKPIVPAQAPIKSKPQPKPSSPSHSPSKPTQLVNRPYVSSDSFRNEVIKFTATSAAAATTSSVTKQSVTTTTRKPLTATTRKPVSTAAKTTSLPLWSWQTSTTAKPTITESGNRFTATTKASAYPTTTRSVITNGPTTRPTIGAVTRATTRATAHSTYGSIRTTARPNLYLNTNPTTRSTTRLTTTPTRSPVSTTQKLQSTTSRPITVSKANTRPISTVRPITTTQKSTTTKTTNRYSALYSPSHSPNLTTKTTTRYTTTSRPTTNSQYQYISVNKPSTAPKTVSKPTTRPITTIRPITTTHQSFITKTTNRSAALYSPTYRPNSTTKTTTRSTTTTRPTTKFQNHYISVNKPTTRPTAPTRLTTIRYSPTTQQPSTTRTTNRYSPTTHQPSTTRTTTRYSTITAPITRQGSTTPRPYLFTSTTKKSATTKNPFDHPFFQKFNAKFEKGSTTQVQNQKATTANKNQTTISPYHAKYEETKIKTGAKTILSYEIGQNRNTTRPKSAFDVYLNWNQNLAGNH